MYSFDRYIRVCVYLSIYIYIPSAECPFFSGCRRPGYRPTPIDVSSTVFQSYIHIYIYVFLVPSFLLLVVAAPVYISIYLSIDIYIYMYSHCRVPLLVLVVAAPATVPRRST